MAIIVFQHSDACRPGRLGLTLRDHAFRLDVRRLDEGASVPVDYDGVEGVVSLGGPQMVDQEHAWLGPEIEYLGGAHERDIPVVGVCLGAQLVAKALGGEVGPMATPEIGFQEVELTPPGQTDTILTGVPWRTRQFQKHRYEVREAPAGATVLASSSACPVQAFRAGLRTYAFQWHMEADRSIVDELTRNAVSELQQAGLSTQEFEEQRDQHYDGFARLNDRVCVNIATFLIPRVANAVHLGAGSGERGSALG